ncbi:MAG: glycoside hydrolase family 43 protein [Phycisphaeraceae bacterium JB051]
MSKTLSEIRIRDPFVLPMASEKKYYLFGTTHINRQFGPKGFDCYTSSDLKHWDGPFPAWRPEPDMAYLDFWAPEVYEVDGSFYMFATLKTLDGIRHSRCFKASSPAGPYHLHGQPLTPEHWACLDATLFIDPQNQPWVIYCHEWKQCFDGGMYAQRLSEELDQRIGRPVYLFSASEAPWTRHSANGPEPDRFPVYVTDGPFIHRTQSGTLLMLWSSCGQKGYAMGLAKSMSGDITGPWEHVEKPVWLEDGGHGMLFRTFEDKLQLAIHVPNKAPDERPHFFEVCEQDDVLVIQEQAIKGESCE